jgi:hypothetical protein
VTASGISIMIAVNSPTGMNIRLRKLKPKEPIISSPRSSCARGAWVWNRRPRYWGHSSAVVIRVWIAKRSQIAISTGTASRLAYCEPVSSSAKHSVARMASRMPRPGRRAV